MDITLKRARVDLKDGAVGRTRHLVDGQTVGQPAELRIVKIDGDPGCYLIRYAADGAELADTYHCTIEDAIAQAAWEYDGYLGDWTDT